MTQVLVSGQGQTDNIGDSVLRRGLLDALRPIGPLVVNVAGMPSSYITGLGLRDGDRTVALQSLWRQELATSLTRGCVFAYNAGEAQLSRRYALTYGRLAPLLVVNRLKGGSAFHVGFGLRAPDPLWSKLLRASLLPCDVVTWRDASSRAWAGVGRVEPDWGYAFGSPAEGQGGSTGQGRSILAVSLRFDRQAPGEVWLRAVRDLAAAENLAIVTLPQVQRDVPRARRLADELGGDLLDWEGDDHASNEARIRSVYRRSRAVISDRLHALIIGHTEGSVPIGLAAGGIGKVERTLRAVGVEGVALTTDGQTPESLSERLAAILARGDSILARAGAAKASLDRLSAELVSVAAARQ